MVIKQIDIKDLSYQFQRGQKNSLYKLMNILNIHFHIFLVAAVGD